MIGIVSHDAGGAEIITSYVQRNKLECAFCVEGPASEVVQRKLGPVKRMPLRELIVSCSWLLCGTSFLSELEWTAISLARKSGKRCAVMLDHWVNYRQRFVRQGEWHWPDELWAGDNVSARIAEEILPEVPVKLVPNAYFEDIRESIAKFPQASSCSDKGKNILYACEPLREDGKKLYNNERHWGYTEEEAIIYFLKNVECICPKIDNITIRPHPQEDMDKYNWVKTEFDLPINCDKESLLFKQVAENHIVAGCATMAMVVGLIAKKRVVSCIPPGGSTIPLPHPQIENMNLLVQAFRK
ncbi:hypothetical protein AUP42_15180 [Thalassospira lucentensis]|uniref:Uncharacterized protein n=1 Tax=Thalassospira lucentensis TaxID=168935 RepID=A0A154L932_9PROT|nr:MULTISPECIES: hypothetical protein [Thalassospira]KZB66866.1 hypothetical protein AUP42_15180 [Thalassospira lucentensis]MCH2273504.1 hypothetical protein [Thalassospira sp.]